MTAQERWLIVVIAFLVLFGSAARRYRPAPQKGEATAAEAPAEAGASSAGADEVRGGDAEVGRIDLNRCDASALERLPGLGPVKARRVIEWRETHGSFRSVEDLMKVRGIGPKTMRRLRSRLTASAANRGESTPPAPHAGEKREDHER